MNYPGAFNPGRRAGISRALAGLLAICSAFFTPSFAEMEVTARFEVTEPGTRLLRVESAVSEGAAEPAACYFHFTTADRDEYSRFEMKNLPGNRFYLTLNLSDVAAGDVLYYIEAVDAGGSVVDRSGVSVYPKAHRYDPDDKEPPYFRRVRCLDVQMEEPLRLSGEVIDPSGIGGMTAFFRHTDELDFRRMPLDRDVGGNFSLELPDSLSRVPGVEFYVEAWDLWGNKSMYGTIENPRRVFVRPRSILNPVFRFIDRPLWLGLNSVPAPEPVEPGLCFVEVDQLVSSMSQDLLNRFEMSFRFDFGRWARIGLDYGFGEWSRFSLAVPLFGGYSGFLVRPGAAYSRTSLMLGFEEGGGHYMVIGRDFDLLDLFILNACFGAGRGRFTAGNREQTLGWFAAFNLATEGIMNGRLNLVLEKDAFNWHASLIHNLCPGLRLRAGWRIPGENRDGLFVLGVGTQFGL